MPWDATPAGKERDSPSPQASPPLRSRKGPRSCPCSSPDLWFCRACRCAGGLWKCLRLAVFYVLMRQIFLTQRKPSQIFLVVCNPRINRFSFTSSVVWDGSRVFTRVPRKHTHDWGKGQTQAILSILGAARQVAEGSIRSFGSSGLVGQVSQTVGVVWWPFILMIRNE